MQPSQIWSEVRDEFENAWRFKTRSDLPGLDDYSGNSGVHFVLASWCLCLLEDRQRQTEAVAAF